MEEVVVFRRAVLPSKAALGYTELLNEDDLLGVGGEDFKTQSARPRLSERSKLSGKQIFERSRLPSREVTCGSVS